jgi:hypothetical protein
LTPRPSGPHSKPPPAFPPNLSGLATLNHSFTNPHNFVTRHLGPGPADFFIPSGSPLREQQLAADQVRASALPKQQFGRRLRRPGEPSFLSRASVRPTPKIPPPPSSSSWLVQDCPGGRERKTQSELDPAHSGCARLISAFARPAFVPLQKAVRLRPTGLADSKGFQAPPSCLLLSGLPLPTLLGPTTARKKAEPSSTKNSGPHWL